MGEEDTNRNPILYWVEGHPLPAAFIAVGLLAVFGALISNLLGGDAPEAAVSTPTSTSGSEVPTTVADVTDDPNRPEVPQVDCRVLLTDDEVDDALFGPDASGPRGSFTFAQGETCLHEPNDESGNYIQIEPGDPADFEDAQLLGVFGETVEGVGDGARWFDDGSQLGVLSVGSNIEDASIIYRIHVGRSDLDGGQRLEQATDLALLALSRFPGSEPAAPEPVVDMCELVTDDQAEQVLSNYRDAHPATRDEIFVSDNFSDPVDLSEEGDAVCTKLILAEIYVETQQGSMSDFEPAASIEGVSSEPVTGVGEQAVWFPNVPHQGSFTAPHERGVLGVRLGDAAFRVVLAVPDTPAEEQLAIATGLAASAVRQIPGVEVPEQEKEVVSFDEEPPQTPPTSLDDVLYRGVDNGEWTLEEGIAAVLDHMVNGTPLVEGDEVDSRSASLVVAAADAYVAENPAASAEIQALLDELAADLDTIPTVPADASAPLLQVSAVPMAQEAPCVPSEETPCWIVHSLDGLEGLEPGRYRVHQYAPSPWTEADAKVVVQVLHDAARKLESIGAMPETTTVALRPDGELYSHVKGFDCEVNVGEFVRAHPTDHMRQIIAREISFCLIGNELFHQLLNNPGNTRWLSHGLANYLSDFVYPTIGFEQVNLPQQLALEELATTLPERRWTNWVFFEYLGGFMDPGGVMDMLGGFPEQGDLVAALAADPRVPDLFHGMERSLTDGDIVDVSGTMADYTPQAWELLLTGPKELPMTVPQFGVRRVHLKVNPGEYGCYMTFSQGDVRLSWRPGPPGEPGQWESAIPDPLEGESVLLLTAVEPGANFTLDVFDVTTDPECEEDEEEGLDPSIIDPILELCEEICDPSTYYWGPLNFGS